MALKTSVGIISIDAYLPPELRKNDWWNLEVTSKWTTPKTVFDESPRQDGETEWSAQARRSMSAGRCDPFGGIVSRHVMPEGMLPSEMELLAAQQAIRKADIDPLEIDLLLCSSAVPDFLITNNACLLHHRLKLSPRCLSLAVDAACNSFLPSMDVAARMITSGAARYALVVQSSAISRLINYACPTSTVWGDGASAAIVGPVSEGRGILGSTHRTDGSLHRVIVGGVEKRRWFDDGRVTVYGDDQSAGLRNFMGLADNGRLLVDEVLTNIGSDPAQVDYFAVHQALPWVLELTRESFGLGNARSAETFSWAGNLFGATLPLGLVTGQKKSLLGPSDLVLMFSLGAGFSFSVMALRWGT